MKLLTSVVGSSLLLGALTSVGAATELPGGPIQPFISPVDAIGVFQDGVWSLDMDGNQSWNDGDEGHSFGVAGDQPVVYAGVTECVWRGLPQVFADIGVYRAPGTWFETKDDFDWQASDDANTFTFGRDGLAAIGRNGPIRLFDYDVPGLWLVDANMDRRWSAGDRAFTFGQAGDRPIVGLWTPGGEPSVGVFYDGFWEIDSNGNETWDWEDESFQFGSPGDLPVTIRFSDGLDRIGVFQNGVWSVDSNNNRRWDGPEGGDAEWHFGSPGDVPVVARGAWKSWDCVPVN